MNVAVIRPLSEMKQPEKLNVVHASGKMKFDFPLQIRISGKELEQKGCGMEDPAMLHDSITPPRRKCGASNWLFGEFRRCISNEGAALMFLELLVSNLRSTTWTLQKLFSKSDGFQEWYQSKQDKMRDDTRLRWAVGMRNDAEKRGFVSAQFSPCKNIKFHLDGTITTEPGIPAISVSEFETVDMVEALEYVKEYIEELVEEAHDKFEGPDFSRDITFRMQFLREQADGQWEPHDPWPG